MVKKTGKLTILATNIYLAIQGDWTAILSFKRVASNYLQVNDNHKLGKWVILPYFIFHLPNSPSLYLRCWEQPRMVG